MGNVICSCTLGDYAKVRLQLSRMLHREIEQLYGEEKGGSDICEIELKCCRREFFINATGEASDIGTAVIVEADGGFDYGIVYSTGAIARKKMQLKGIDQSKDTLGNIVRYADEHDKAELLLVKEREPEIRDVCIAKVKGHRLDMKLVDVELRMDQQKVTVFYTATHRVDFRSLVRDLASEFKARIQMVQITSREEARRANTFGACGCVLCCSSWIQKIHANPFAEKQNGYENSHGENHSFNVIGQCNRPKCCLSYSRKDKCSKKSRQNSYPPLGSKVTTTEGIAIIEGIDPAKKEISLRYPTDGKEVIMPIEEFEALFVKK
ncbi:MAG: PSP1 domain-containing protein [Chlorobium sp.]|nr:PSP1 domain-containing protein [Chlorobium sp.]MCW8814788.1 PSP1 domain-containing protein [Chlorobium sp.]MCW8819896.1 PSP1 domain-containing protein [Ignavibacteriaceae bacterium]